jgi:hypothetical protein
MAIWTIENAAAQRARKQGIAFGCALLVGSGLTGAFVPELLQLLDGDELDPIGFWLKSITILFCTVVLYLTFDPHYLRGFAWPRGGHAG